MTTETETFGRDTLCLDTLKTGRYATGKRVVAQRCYHRLITPRGMLRGGADEQNFGIDLPGMCGGAVTTELEAAIGPRVKNELLKDPQVETVSVSVEKSGTVLDRTWTITVSATTAAGPFELVLEVDSVTVKLLRVD